MNEKTTALAISIKLADDSELHAQQSLSELVALLDTIGIEVVQEELIKLANPKSKYLLGVGKTEEMVEQAKALEVDLIVFDRPLSPSQQRNWEALGIAVMDREAVILEIFSERATTKEARLQIELATLAYGLPRLKGAWDHLSRQRGGAKGTRGEGETQLEVDRRIVARRMARLRTELKGLASTRQTQGKARRTLPFPTGAIVGYTNAGKSSLLSELSQTDLFIEDKLFATLDPTTRRVDLPGGNVVLLTDTVGFIQNLPHHLVEAFKSTLEEALYADFLVLLVDASDPKNHMQLETTRQVLAEMGSEQPQLIVYSKADLLSPETRETLERIHPDACVISTHAGYGMDRFIEKISDLMYDGSTLMRVSIPPKAYHLVSLAHREVQIELEEIDNMGNTLMVLRIPERLVHQFRPYEMGVASKSTSETSEGV